ncbi:MAG: 2-C-methyl-D-erythritol 4-phosphate cytidylyltransferase [Parahaliea sp.]
MSGLCKKARLFAVVPAAGVGRRMAANQPKQYLELAGVPVLQHSLQALLHEARIERIIVALKEGDRLAETISLLNNKRVIRVAGGAERVDSVLAGLRALTAVAKDNDWVLVHDAARPCLGAADLDRLIEHVLSSGTGAILAQPVIDTLKQADSEGCVQATVDRRCFWRAQTPQMFLLGPLREALERALTAGVSVTDEAMAMEYSDHRVELVRGSASNLKITRPEDLPLAAFYLSQQLVTASVLQA